MNLNLFGWLRSKAREAVLAGIGDALTVFDGDSTPADAAIPEAIVHRLRLVASTSETTPTDNPSAEPTTSEPATSEPATSGKRGRKATTPVETPTLLDSSSPAA